MAEPKTKKAIEIEKRMSFELHKRDNIRISVKNELKRARIIWKLLDDTNLNNKKILDVGCGLGACLLFLKQRANFSEMIGVDIYPVASQKLESKGIKLFEWDLNKGFIPFNDNEFDITICSNIMEHIFFQHAILKELKRVTKNGGTVIIALGNDYHIKTMLQILLNRKVESHGIDTFARHFFININQAKNFISTELIIEDYYHYPLDGKLQLPSKLLCNVIPRLFASGTVFKCRVKK